MGIRTRLIESGIGKFYFLRSSNKTVRHQALAVVKEMLRDTDSMIGSQRLAKVEGELPAGEYYLLIAEYKYLLRTEALNKIRRIGHLHEIPEDVRNELDKTIKETDFGRTRYVLRNRANDDKRIPGIDFPDVPGRNPKWGF